MSKHRRHYQPVVPNQCLASGADTALAVLGERQLSCARVPTIEGPFRFAVADDKGSWSGHDGREIRHNRSRSRSYVVDDQSTPGSRLAAIASLGYDVEFSWPFFGGLCGNIADERGGAGREVNGRCVTLTLIDVRRSFSTRIPASAQRASTPVQTHHGEPRYCSCMTFDSHPYGLILLLPLLK